MRAMILKEFRELRRDKRTLAMLIVMPLLLLVIFGYAANFHVDTLKVAVLGSNAPTYATMLANAGVNGHQSPFEATVVDPNGDRAQAELLLREDRVDVAVLTGEQPPLALVDGSNLFAAQSAVSVLNKLGDQVQYQILFNPSLKTSWVMVPAIIGLILTFIGTLITSIGLVRERETGTLEQLAVMPIRPSTVILGKITPYFVLASFDMAAITGLGILLFNVPFSGNPLIFVLGASLFLFVVLGLGVFISTVSRTTGQSIQLAFLFVMPQILLSGMIFPLDSMGEGVRWIGYLLPLTYFTIISQGVMLRDAPMSSLWPALVVLAGMAIVVFTGATLRFRRDLAPSRHTPHTPGPPAGKHEKSQG